MRDTAAAIACVLVVAYEPSRVGRDQSNGGSLLVTYVITRRQVFETSVLETYFGAGGGALATRPRSLRIP